MAQNNLADSIATLGAALVLGCIFADKKLAISILDNHTEERSKQERNLTILNRRLSAVEAAGCPNIWLSPARSAIHRYEMSGKETDLNSAIRALESAEFFTN